MNVGVTVVVTSKNNKDILGACLDSVLAQTYKDTRCVLADDSSSDGTSDFVAFRYPHVKIVVNDSASGPAESRNIALKHVTTPYVLFMDSDAELEKDWVEKAVKILDGRPDVAVIGGKIFNGDGSLQSTATFFHITGVSGCWKQRDTDYAEYLWWPSSTMMARTDLINKVGGFDPSYCYLYEDSDIGWRITISGYKILYCSQLHSVHRISTTVRRSFKKRRIMYLKKKNKMITLLGNLEMSTLLRYGWQIFGFWLAELIILPNKGSVLWGNLVGTFSFSHIRAKRKQIKAYRKVLDKDVVSLMSTSVIDMFSYGVPND